jgi:glycosyltransferase involved in cell wall biosynthesis
VDSGNARTSPVRVLHVLGGMNRGGVETWLMHVLRHIDRNCFKMDFLVHTVNPCAYDDEIHSLGSEIIPCLHPSRPWNYARNFKRVLKEHGPYDVVHSHVHHFSGYILRLARQAGVPTRIAHSHNDTAAPDRKPGLKRSLYLRLCKKWIYRNATKGLAASREAALALFGDSWEGDPRWTLLYCAIDLDSFRFQPNRDEVHRELGLPAGAMVVGHVGRFDEAKNHDFLIDIACAMARRSADIYYLLLGDGPLRERIRRKAERAGIADRVIFAGVRADVPRVMLGAMDLFLMPSHHEGLPLVLMEAQAAGLPCVISSVISPDTDVVGHLIRRLPLSLSADEWAGEALSMLRLARLKPGQTPVPAVVDSRFNISRGVNSLKAVYQTL